MTEINFSRPDDIKRGGWNVQAGELYDECLTDGEALEVFIAVSRGEKPPYLRSEEEWQEYKRRHEEKMQALEDANK